jgi:hypothetical protein
LSLCDLLPKTVLRLEQATAPAMGAAVGLGAKGRTVAQG